MLLGGTVSPGGTGTIQTTALTGNYVQSAGGTLAVDADWPTSASDKLAITGTAKLAGKVVVNPIGLLGAGVNLGQVKTFTILTATGVPTTSTSCRRTRPGTGTDRPPVRRTEHSASPAISL